MATLRLKTFAQRSLDRIKEDNLAFETNWEKIQVLKGHCVQLRFFLAKLDIIKFPDSTFDSNRFIDKYKSRAG